MLTRPIPSTGEALPALGLGTWRTFDVGASEAELAPRLEVLRRFFAGGGRLIDSSPMYGRSESVVGELLARLEGPVEPFLATKVWTSGRDAGIAQMQTSMRRMGARDRIDLMQVHNLLDWRIHLDTLRRWKEAGTVRYVGVTHYLLDAFDELERILREEPIDFVQLPYSVRVREAEARLLPLAQDRGVAVIVMRPLEAGGLVRASRSRPLPHWAAELDCSSWSQLFLKFILAHPAVTCAIPATANPEHLEDDLRAGEGRLPGPGERRRLVEEVAG
jgi:aryl-alcohol dehydrogenase-like predicted oxidoreductase